MSRLRYSDTGKQQPPSQKAAPVCTLSRNLISSSLSLSNLLGWLKQQPNHHQPATQTAANQLSQPFKLTLTTSPDGASAVVVAVVAVSAEVKPTSCACNLLV
jgi:hypothetical protein